MRKIIYYVATSIDGYIAGIEDDISDFATGGTGVEKYLDDLKGFETVIMGRRTYEFGYKYGLTPGQPAYPHMDHHIFSNTLKLPAAHDNVHVLKRSLVSVQAIKNREGGDIYLCGGGIFAGWLLNNQLIDEAKIKLNPFILGKGIPLFVDVKASYRLELVSSKRYDDGLQIMDFRVKY